jgi:predicted ATPase
VLDDLQHADDASLEIIEALIADDKSKSLLIICTYQDNDRVRAVFTDTC